VVVLLLVLASGHASAERPVGVRVGLGVTAKHSDDFYSPATRYGPGLQADVGYRVLNELALGIHVGLTRHQVTYHEPGDFIDPDGSAHKFVHSPLRLGIGAQWSVDRFWLAPWVGRDEGLAFGLGSAVDVGSGPSGHRIGVYLDVARSTERSHSNVYGSAGLAYRYW
jgi:hypothetical protein